MAPEYVVHGKLTEKADVYSFGVVVIEVVTGKRNNSFTQNSSVLRMVKFVLFVLRHMLLVHCLRLSNLSKVYFFHFMKVWNLYGTSRLHEAVDPVLEGNHQVKEASQLLQIGLLCAQASAELRPSMSIIVKMLTGNHEILQPTQPPFISSTSAEISPRIPSETYKSQPSSNTQSSGNTMTESLIEPR